MNAPGNYKKQSRNYSKHSLDDTITFQYHSSMREYSTCIRPCTAWRSGRQVPQMGTQNPAEAGPYADIRLANNFVSTHITEVSMELLICQGKPVDKNNKHNIHLIYVAVN